MNVLIVGAGVIGIVYGAQLGAAGHTVSVLAHGPRTDAVREEGLRVQDAVSGVELCSRAAVVDATAGKWDRSRARGCAQ
jgi:2-dehydropantoate 2-reductase